MSFPIGLGFWKQGADDVCTPYNVALPYSTNLIAHSSIYNICDIWADTSKTLPLKDEVPIENSPCAYIEDLSGSSNPMIGTNTARSAIYKTSPEIYAQLPTLNNINVNYTIDNSLRINSDVKTIVFLMQLDNTSSNLITRIIRNQLQLRFNSGVLSVFDGSNRNSSLAGTSNTWHIISLRTDDNIVLGIDKNYEEVKVTAPNIVDEDFSIFSTQDAAPVRGKFRELLIYSESISDANLDDISDWLTDKWNL